MPQTALALLRLLADDAPAEQLEAQARRLAAGDAEMGAAAHDLALRVRAVMDARRRRESELTALVEVARDLASLRDSGGVLDAIVRRARTLVGTDVAYLTLFDPEAGDTIMRATAGSVSARFQNLRLPLGAGLGGLVAQTSHPYWTADYPEDERFRHTGEIDDVVGDEGLVAICGGAPAGRGRVRGPAVRLQPDAPGLHRRRGLPARLACRTGRGVARAVTARRRTGGGAGRAVPGPRDGADPHRGHREGSGGARPLRSGRPRGRRPRRRDRRPRIRDNPARARALGYPIERYQLLVFALSAFLSGITGGVFAISHGFASLQEVYWTTSGKVVVMTILGGSARSGDRPWAPRSSSSSRTSWRRRASTRSAPSRAPSSSSSCCSFAAASGARAGRRTAHRASRARGRLLPDRWELRRARRPDRRVETSHPGSYIPPGRHMWTSSSSTRPRWATGPTSSTTARWPSSSTLSATPTGGGGRRLGEGPDHARGRDAHPQRLRHRRSPSGRAAGHRLPGQRRGRRPVRAHPVRDGQRLQVGALQVVVVATPGHTENHLSYVVTRARTPTCTRRTGSARSVPAAPPPGRARPRWVSSSATTTP